MPFALTFFSFKRLLQIKRSMYYDYFVAIKKTIFSNITNSPSIKGFTRSKFVIQKR